MCLKICLYTSCCIPTAQRRLPFSFGMCFLSDSCPILQRFVSLPTSPQLPTIDTIQGLHELQNKLYDRIIVKELDLYYAKQPALPFLLCLKCNIFCNEKARTLRSVPQLLSWNTVSHQHQVKRLGRLDLIDEFMPQKSVDILRKFLYDTSRAGRYAVCGDMYADASLACLGYLLFSRLGAPVHLHHTRRTLARRRKDSPWKWRTILKCLHANTPVGDVDALPHREFLRKQQLQQMYMDAVLLALKLLLKALRRSAKSDALVTLANADKPFSQRALKFPGHVKKCRAAIATYLARAAEQQPAGEWNNF